MEAIGQELLFVVSPVLVAVVGATYGGESAVIAVAALVVLGSAGFAMSLCQLDEDVPAERARAGSVREGATAGAEHRGRLATIVVASGLVMAALGMIDLTLVVWARERGTPALAGVLTATWAVGSIAGGIVSVTTSWLRPGIARRLGWLAAGTALLIPVLPPVTSAPAVLVCIALGIGGTTIAPAFAVLYAAVAAEAPSHRRAEAFGWQSGASTVGLSAGVITAGQISDVSGPALASALAVALCVVAAVLPPVVGIGRAL